MMFLHRIIKIPCSYCPRNAAGKAQCGAKRALRAHLQIVTERHTFVNGHNLPRMSVKSMDFEIKMPKHTHPYS